MILSSGISCAAAAPPQTRARPTATTESDRNHGNLHGRTRNPIPEQIRDLHEERAIGALEVGRQEQRLVIVVKDQIALTVAVVVANIEDGAGVHAIGDQQVHTECPAERVVLHDVPKQKPVRELVGRRGAENFDVEHLGLIQRVNEAARGDVHRRLEPADGAQRHEQVTAGPATEKRRVAETDLVAPVEAAPERHEPAGVDVPPQRIASLEEVDAAEPLHLVTDVAVEPDVLRE